MDEVMDEISEGIKGGEKLESSGTVKVNGEMNGACDESMEVSEAFSKSPLGDSAGNEDDLAEDQSGDDSSPEDAVEDAASALPNNNEELDGEDEEMEVDSEAREVPNKECDTSSSEVPHTSNDKSEDNLEESLSNGPCAQSSSNVNSEVDEEKLNDESDVKDEEEEDEEDLEEKFEDEDLGEKLEDEDLEEKLEDEDLEEKLQDEDLKEKLEDEDLEGKLEDEDLEGKLEDEDLEGKLEDEDLEGKLEDEDLEEKLEDEDLEEKLEDEDLEEKLEDEDLEEKLDDEDLEEKLDDELNEGGENDSEQSGDLSDKKVENESSETKDSSEQNIGNSESDDKMSETDRPRTLQNGGAATPDGSEDPQSSEKADKTPEEVSPGKSESNETKEEEAGDDEDNTPTKKGKGKKKADPVPVTLTPRRSSRNLNKQKSYVEDKDDLPERDDGSDIEEITMVDPLAVPSDLTRENKENSKARNSRGGPNKTIVVNDTKHLVEIASGSKSVKGVKKEPTLVIIDTNSILSGRGPIPATQQHSLHKTPQRSQLQITPAHPIHSTTITQSYSVVPVTSHQQPSHSSSSSSTPRLPTSSTITPVKPPIILPSLTDDMYVVEAPSFIVPYVYEKPPVKSLKDFIETLQENIKAAKEAERIRKEEATKKAEESKNKDSGKETDVIKEKKDEDSEKKEEAGKIEEKKEAAADKDKSDETNIKGKDEEMEVKGKDDDADVKSKDEEVDVKGKGEEADVKGKDEEADVKGKDDEADVKGKDDEADVKGKDEEVAVKDKDEDIKNKDEDADLKSKNEEAADEENASKKTSEDDAKMEVDEEGKKEKNDADITDDSKKDVEGKEKIDKDKESKEAKDGEKEDQVNDKLEKEDSKKEDSVEVEKDGKEDEVDKNRKSEKAAKDSKEDEGKDRKNEKEEESKDKKRSSEAEEKEEETAKDLKVHPSEKDQGKVENEVKDSSKSEESKKPTSYFENPLGKFFIQIGINLVQEYVQTDLLRSQRKKREREGGKGGVNTQMAISSLEQTLEFSKENNEPFHLKQKKCDFCNFKTESALVMAHHMETPHMRNYVYRCNFCPMEVRSPHDILFHMEAEHNVRGRLERGPAFHQCPSCSFEDNQKGKLTRHLVSCQKRYRPEKNQEPPLDWEPPAKIPRVSRNRPGFPMSGASPGGAGLPGVTKTPSMMGQPHPLLPKLAAGATLMGQTPVGGVNTIGRGRGRPPMQGRFVPDMKQAQVIQQQVPRPISAQTLRQGMLYRSSPAGPQSQVLLPTSYHIGNQIYQVVGGQLVGGMSVTMPSQGGLMPNMGAASLQNAAGKVQSKVQQQPSISITPLPRHPTVTPPNAHSASLTTGIKPGHPSGGKATFVICEICDGYIKDLEQLRSHMQWIHKVKIHPKMIFNRPPLNCQKCQFRFFTDQGLERHLLGSHGLVTSSMQEAANKGKDGGRCPVCGRVYQWKLLNHVARDHSMTLKPAHLSYKCTVCTATFGMYKQFENHVYTAHSVVAKRVMEKKPGAGGGSGSGSSSSQGVAGRAVASQRPAAASPQGESLLKPLKINDEITIIPQPARARPGSTGRPSPSPAHVQTKSGAEERERPSRPKDGAEVIDLEGAAGKDALSAVQERLRRRTSLEVSQVEPEQPPNKKSRKD